MRGGSGVAGIKLLYTLLIGSGDTPLSRAPTHVKAALMAAAIALTALSRQPLALAALAGLTLTVSALSRDYAAFVKCVRGVKYLLALLLLATAASAIAGGSGAWQALAQALTTCLRTALLLTCFATISSSLSLAEVLSIARSLRMPKYVAYSVVLAVRFVPLVIHDLANVVDSLRIKGVYPGRGVAGRVRALRSVLQSTIIILTRRAERVAESIELRGILE